MTARLCGYLVGIAAGVTVFIAAGALGVMITEWVPRYSWAQLTLVIAAVVAGAVAALRVASWIKDAFALERLDPSIHQCPACDYDLTGHISSRLGAWKSSGNDVELLSGLCPECGKPWTALRDEAGESWMLG